MKETWKPIKSYAGAYFVSNLGYIRNKRGLIIKQKPSKDGYVRVSLFNGTKYKREYIHRLVANAFIPNPDGKDEVNHIDGNKRNNQLNNLEWVTRIENHYHAVKMGLKPTCPTIGKYGADNPLHKPILQLTTEGEIVSRWECAADAAEFLGCSVRSIRGCAGGFKKTCKGYVWKYTTE